jgi:kynurenine formamidase
MSILITSIGTYLDAPFHFDRDPTRPAHTLLLRAGILIVENLTGLNDLAGEMFTFVAVPAKIAGAAAFPVRAFALPNAPV